MVIFTFMEKIFTPDFLNFFIELAPNNNKDWFDQNRSRYEKNVKEPFKYFVQQLITEFSKIDPKFKETEPKDCIFRINRDIRFSKDKSPYKLQVSAVISPEGKKSRAIDGIYIELTPEHVRVYGGVYEVDKDDLQSIREGIAKNLNEFRKLISNQDFRKVFGELRGEKNKVLPKELKNAGEQEPLMYNKQWYFFTEFDPEIILEQDLIKRVIEVYKVARPVEQFFNRFIK
ncbi:MAG: DUF2461 domain-containing protein [Bacteroidetes bacterium]|nr:MAG: DUF2461 domain-containing protein [Bacteroidota bacterium]TNE97039.1 MAG: DUF2461 domain-containing protein [Bacteroidota bacterium]